MFAIKSNRISASRNEVINNELSKYTMCVIVDKKITSKFKPTVT